LKLITKILQYSAQYLRKLHEFGKKIRRVTSAKVWFGNKTLTVKELVSSVGKYLGASEEAVSHLVRNLDVVVTQVNILFYAYIYKIGFSIVKCKHFKVIECKQTGAPPPDFNNLSIQLTEDNKNAKITGETSKQKTKEEMNRRKSVQFSEAEFIDDE